MRGSQPWLVILCVPSDQSTPAWPDPAYFEGLITPSGGGLADYWSQVSNGSIDLTGSRVLGWYKLTQTVAEIDKVGRAAAAAIARGAATKAGVDVSGYQHTLTFIVGSNHYGAQGADVAAGVGVVAGQSYWRWCTKCEGLSYWSSGDPLPCPGGGTHTYGSASLYIVSHGAAGVDGQAGWRFCRKCGGLVHADSGPKPCAGGGDHNTSSSGAYFVRHGSTGAGEQAGWKFCNKCHVLSFSQAACAAGDKHDHAGSGAYSLPFSFSAGMGGLAHETGHGYGFEHAFGTSRSGDHGNDSRTGAYGDPTDIMSWANSTGFASAQFTASGPGMSAPTLIKMGWLGSDAYPLNVGSGPATVGIAPLYSAPGSNRALQIVHAAVNRIYTVSLRTATRWDRGFGKHRVVIHRQHTLYGAGQPGWSHCESCDGMIFNRTTDCPAGGAHDGSTSGEYTLAHNAGPSAGEGNWRYCRKCQGLVFAGAITLGRCAAGGDHDTSVSGEYALPSSGAGQAGWRWCKKCQGLIFGTAMKGACAAGGLHDLGKSYVIDSATGANRQAGWRWCAKCYGMYFAAYVTCVGGKPHKFVGDDYALAHNLSGVDGQAGWRFCKKCHGLGRAAGKCAGGGMHDHSGSGSYVLPIDAERTGGQARWFHCGQCSSLHFAAGDTGGRCTAGRTHTLGGQYIVGHSTTPSSAARFRWCRACSCLVLGDNPTGCVAGGNHDTSGSGHYTVRTEPGPPPRDQGFWRRCTACNQLMHLNTADGSNELGCPVGGKHKPSGEHFLTIKDARPDWRACSKCDGLAYWEMSKDPGNCPAGGKHEHSASPHFMPPRRHDDAVQVLAENLAAGASYTIPGTLITVAVNAITDTSASLYVTL